tara:strand:+ start:1322 stop:1705 length:384 start_codon:yes stop_codon:yes gene_type:complete
MNYLNAAKKSVSPLYYPEKQSVPTNINNEVVLTNDENYLKNVEDSIITGLLSELQDMCMCFVEDSLIMENPILIKHHYGRRSFVSEILNLFQETAYVDISEEEEEESEEEDELDPIDIYSSISNDKF